MSLLVETILACKVCGHEKLDGPIQHSGEHDIYQCRTCDVVFAHPMRNPGPEWYEKFQVSHRLGGADALTWDHKMFLKDITVSAQTLLDVGCGSGVFLAAAKKKGFAVTGVDFDSNAISVAKAGHGLDDLFCGSLGQFIDSFPDRKFDIVTFFGILEHLDNPVEFLSRTAKLLKQDGQIAFTVPYRDRRPNFGFKEWWDQPPFHLTKWSEKAVRNILAQKGFQVIKVVTGRSQFDDVIDWFRARVLKRGIVSKIVHQADRQRDDAKRRALMRRAVLLNKFASLAYSVLKFPAVFFLFLIRATGKSMYVNAQKKR